VLHGHVRAKVSDAHCHLLVPINEGPQGLSLLLEDVNQGDGGSVVRSASGKLHLKIGHQRRKSVDEVGESFVNQLRAPPFSDVGNTQHRTASSEVYKLIYIVYTYMCLSGSVVSS